MAQYEQDASSQLKIFDLDGKKLVDLALPAIGTVYSTGGKWNHDEVFYGFQSFTVRALDLSLRLEKRIHIAVDQSRCAFDRRFGV